MPPVRDESSRAARDLVKLVTNLEQAQTLVVIRSIKHYLTVALSNFGENERLKWEQAEKIVMAVCRKKFSITMSRKLLQIVKLESNIPNEAFLRITSKMTSFAVANRESVIIKALFFVLFRLFLRLENPEKMEPLFPILWPFVKYDHLNVGVVYTLYRLLKPHMALAFQVQSLWKLYCRCGTDNNSGFLLLLLSRYKEIRPDLVPMNLPPVRVTITRHLYMLEDRQHEAGTVQRKKQSWLIAPLEVVPKQVRSSKLKSMLLDTNFIDLLHAFPDLSGPRTTSSWLFNPDLWQRLLLSAEQERRLHTFLQYVLIEILCLSRPTAVDPEEKRVVEATVALCEFTGTVMPFLPHVVATSLSTPNCYDFLSEFLRLVTIWPHCKFKDFEDNILDPLSSILFAIGDSAMEMEFIQCLGSLCCIWSSYSWTDLVGLQDYMNRFITFCLSRKPGNLLLLLTAVKVYVQILCFWKDAEVKILVQLPNCVIYQAFASFATGLVSLASTLFSIWLKMENVLVELPDFPHYEEYNRYISNNTLPVIADVYAMLFTEMGIIPEDEHLIGEDQKLIGQTMKEDLFPGIDNFQTALGIWRHPALYDFAEEFKQANTVRGQESDYHKSFLQYLEQEGFRGFTSFFLEGKEYSKHFFA